MIDPEKLRLSEVPDPATASDQEIWNFLWQYPADRVYGGWLVASGADYDYGKDRPGIEKIDDVEKMLLFMAVRAHHARELAWMGPVSREHHRKWLVRLRELLVERGDSPRPWVPTHRSP